jgi:tRNA uridine 5-carboxymethylaminomethyl modification enzyme
MNTYYDCDVVVVGGGHAGIEAAHAASRMGSRTILITLHINKIGHMPCNPAVGGIGKGHIVYEISALGGLMPKLCTKTYLQARMLNTRKGPAVQGLRLQIDKFAYSSLSQQLLSQTHNLTILAGTVDEIIVDNSCVRGVRLADGTIITACSVVITTGTFLQGLIHIGDVTYAAGRRDEEAVTGLSTFLRKIGLQLGRLKTGTPPRLLRSSLDFEKMEYQEADNLTHLFEFYPHTSEHKKPCYMTYTNEKTHEIIKKNLHRSAMYSGAIRGIGPRYCPSIEDKIGRFPDKTSHHVFVEPEGEHSHEVYPNGISTSLPYEVQEAYVRTIVGFENAIITKAGYAVEYDFVLPHQLYHSLQVKTVKGLFLAGQINGTTGYEEAAGQGIVAGINAHLQAHGKDPFILDRTESYIGVMIDDLVTMSVDEPYRMFTSRAERRLLLRQDNAFLRLTDRAYQLGLIDQNLYHDFTQEKQIINDCLRDLKQGKNNHDILRLLGQESYDINLLRTHVPATVSDRALCTVQAELMYEPYIAREQQEVKKMEQYKKLHIPDNFAYLDMSGLSKELQQKLDKHRPQSIAQAALIPGMTPAALSLLIFKIRKSA